MTSPNNSLSKETSHPASVCDLAKPSALHVIGTLAWRELVRFFRQRNRVIGALGQPILFWLLFGAGLKRSFAMSAAGQGSSFLEYYFPGSLVLVLMFTAIFATISIIEDRREGFLQSVLVAPIPRWSMVMGKVIGGSSIAVIQGMLFLFLSLTLDVAIDPVTIAALLLILSITAIALTSVGFVIAWRMESTQGFHAIMNLLLMPMWLLSGSFFPISSITAKSTLGEMTMHWVMRLNPLTYCVSAVRQLIYDAPTPEGFFAPELSFCLIVTPVFAIVALIAAWYTAGFRTTGDLL